MIVTPFGDLDFMDKAMMQQWTAAHGIRHRTYGQRMSQMGRALSPAPLLGEPGDAWLRIHYMHHMALSQIMKPDASVSAQSLATDPAESATVFYNWHRAHNLIHFRLDQALGIL